MSTKIITDPRLSQNYKYLIVDSSGKYLVSTNDQILGNLQNYVNIIYNNLVLFNNENTNTNNLDKYSIIINNNVNKILEIVKPCIEEAEDPFFKCTTDKCKYMSDVQNILLDYELLLNSIITGDIKKKYDFLPFFIHYNFVKLITDNKSNKNLSITSAFILCNSTNYYKPIDNPELQQQFEALMAQKLDTQTQVVEANKMEFILKILIYIFVSIIAFVIFAFLLKKYYLNKKEVNKVVGGLLNLYTGSKIHNF